jgi:hypothetical protein
MEKPPRLSGTPPREGKSRVKFSYFGGVSAAAGGVVFFAVLFCELVLISFLGDGFHGLIPVSSCVLIPSISKYSNDFSISPDRSGILFF